MGYYLGVILERYWLPSPYGLIVGMMLGVGATVRLTVKLIRQSTRLEEDDEQKPETDR